MTRTIFLKFLYFCALLSFLSGCGMTTQDMIEYRQPKTSAEAGKRLDEVLKFLEKPGKDVPLRAHGYLTAAKLTTLTSESHPGVSRILKLLTAETSAPNLELKKKYTSSDILYLKQLAAGSLAEIRHPQVAATLLRIAEETREARVQETALAAIGSKINQIDQDPILVDRLFRQLIEVMKRSEERDDLPAQKQLREFQAAILNIEMVNKLIDLKIRNGSTEREWIELLRWNYNFLLNRDNLKNPPSHLLVDANLELLERVGFEEAAKIPMPAKMARQIIASQRPTSALEKTIDQASASMKASGDGNPFLTEALAALVAPDHPWDVKTGAAAISQDTRNRILGKAAELCRAALGNSAHAGLRARILDALLVSDPRYLTEFLVSDAKEAIQSGSERAASHLSLLAAAAEAPETRQDEALQKKVKQCCLDFLSLPTDRVRGIVAGLFIDDPVPLANAIAVRIADGKKETDESFVYLVEMYLNLLATGQADGLGVPRALPSLTEVKDQATRVARTVFQRRPATLKLQAAAFLEKADIDGLVDILADCIVGKARLEDAGERFQAVKILADCIFAKADKMSEGSLGKGMLALTEALPDLDEEMLLHVVRVFAVVRHPTAHAALEQLASNERETRTAVKFLAQAALANR